MYVPSFIRIERGSDGAHDFKYNKVPLFARKPGNINTSLTAAPKQALVPASRYCYDVKYSYLNVCDKFHQDLKRLRWVPMTSNITRYLCLLENQGISIFRYLLPRNYLLCQQAVITAMMLAKPQCMCQVSLGLKEVQMGGHDFKYNKVPLLA